MNVRSLFTYALSFFLLIVINAASSQSLAEVKGYQIKSGIVVYTLSGTRKGTETVYFDN